MAPLLISSVPGAFLVSKSLPLYVIVTRALAARTSTVPSRVCCLSSVVRSTTEYAWSPSPGTSPPPLRSATRSLYDFRAASSEAITS
jgi:hypothetical protein